VELKIMLLRNPTIGEMGDGGTAVNPIIQNAQQKIAQNNAKSAPQNPYVTAFLSGQDNVTDEYPSTYAIDFHASPDSQWYDTLPEVIVTAQPAAPVTVVDLIASGAITATAAQPVINSTTTEVNSSSVSMQSGNAVPIESDAVYSAESSVQTTPKIPWGLLLSLGLALWG
jgi:hypothetical protein